jgi:CheY-like chemotaxis protein
MNSPILTPKILICEDDETTLYLLNQIIGSLGRFEIKQCPSAAEALEAIYKDQNIWKPNLIVSDFMMDNGDGIDLLKKIRFNFNPEIPFLFVTSASPKLIHTFISHDTCSDIISKPLNLTHIKNALIRFNIIIP